MGAYKFDPLNPPVMGGGKRQPLKPGGTCDCGVIYLAPRFLRPLVHRIVSPAKVPTVTEKDLHPNVDRVVSALLNLQEATADSAARNGKAVRIAFAKPARTGDDFGVDLTIRVGDENVFTGHLVARDVWKRGKISFAHAVIGAIELLYLHLLENAPRNLPQVDMRLGILEISGRASGLGTVNDLIQQEIAAAMAQQQNEPGGTCQPGPFDPLAIYGAFPSSGFGYFHGIRAEMVEQRFERRPT
jgi:hypothetical protein